MPQQFLSTLDSFVPDGLCGRNYPVTDRGITIASGAGVLKRGTVLGKITASGKYVKSLAAAEDGSQTPDCILSKDVDATSADAAALVYLSGEFVESSLVLGTGHTAASIREGLRDKNIYLITSK